MILKFNRNKKGLFVCNLSSLIDLPCIHPTIDRLVMHKAIEIDTNIADDEFRSDDINNVKETTKHISKQLPISKSDLKKAEFAQCRSRDSRDETLDTF